MTTVSGTNIDQVLDIIDAVVEAGANVFAFARYCPTSEERDVGIEPLRYRKLLKIAIKSLRNMKRPVVRPILTERIIFGPCMNMKPVLLKSLKRQRMV